MSGVRIEPRITHEAWNKWEQHQRVESKVKNNGVLK